jgi:spore protease
MMEQRQFFESIGVYSDLALEAHELLRGQMGVEVPGVREDKEQYPEADVTTVTIMSPEGAAIMGKAPGTYITIEAPRIRENNLPVLTEIASVLAKKLAELLDHHRIGPNDSVLLVGLGNWEATPDSLGPKVINRLMVTRHIFRYAPRNSRAG